MLTAVITRSRDLLRSFFNCFTCRSCGGYPSVGQLAADIHNPQRSFLVAVVSVICLTLFFSILPLATAICIIPEVEVWKTFSIHNE